jgi:uncharacterized membrane protein YfcA
MYNYDLGGRSRMLDPYLLFTMAFAMAFINDGLGGGYGTLSTPLLLVFGYPANVAIPSVLVSEASSETFSSIWHGRFKNINYRTFGFATIGGILGIVLAVVVIGIFLTSTSAKLYIGSIAVVMGAFVILRSYPWLARHSHIKDNTNRPITAGLGALCGFNKSSTGGGYGPLSTSGFQVLGLAPARAVGTTILTKGTACVISIILWSGLVGINWQIALPMTVGAFVGAPVAAWLNNYLRLRLDPPFHGRLLGAVMSALGVYTVLHVLGYV